MKKVLSLVIGLLLTPVVFADNLLQVYEQAKLTNPELKSAFALKERAYAAIAGSRASLLPQLGLSASYGLSHGYREAKDVNNKNGNLSLTLSQTLFDFSSWKNLDITKKQASIFDVTYQTAEQKLILNTAIAYFEVLKNLDNLTFIAAQKQSIYRQWQQTEQKHKVGLVAITDVQNAKAQYDLTVAQQISALNDLNNSIENLRQITGRFYSNLASINTKSFQTDQPPHISQLLQQAENTNLPLLTARLNQDLAKDQIRLAQSGYMPTISLQASTGLTKSENYGYNAATPPNQGYANNNSINGKNSVSVQLNLPIFSGGATMSQVEQAQYNYVSYSELLDNTNRTVVNQVRSSYNNINAAISSISAYQQSVISSQSSLDATESGYSVGTRTIVDVLTATTQLYNAKKNLSDAKYNYLISILTLKNAVGVLSADDLITLNNMLGSEVTTLVNID